jgi:ribosomal protein S18 acetylase RimI-like enzyme
VATHAGMACLRNLVIGALSRAGPVNLAAALRHHSRDHTDRSPPLASGSDETDNTQERRSPAAGPGARVSLPGRPSHHLDLHLTSSAAALSCRPSWSSACASWPSPTTRRKTADGAAAAAWLPPPGRWQLSRPQRLRLLPALVRFLGLRTVSVLGGLDRMEARHPHDRSHWYLFILGIEQAAQGRGLGSALLAQVLARVDADDLPVYLESSSERNLAWYGRHGFEITSEVAIPGGPKIWPMWREPELERVVTEGSVLIPASGRPARCRRPVWARRIRTIAPAGVL